MEENIKEYSENFVKRLGKFIGEEAGIAFDMGISEDERRAIHARAFQLLGRNADTLQKKAKKI
jgi:hypothetical protein